jgi:hypothetical protein
MAWTPKGTAPATFNLADAFLALITGDSTWGWLVDWLPYVTNDHFNTAAFCAAGPTVAPDLTVALGPSPPDRNPLVTAAKIASSIVAITMAARQRVFEAYCQTNTASWDTQQCVVVGTAGRGSVSMPSGIVVPTGATRVRVDITPKPIASASSDAGVSLWWYDPVTTNEPAFGEFGPPGGINTPYETDVGGVDGWQVWYYPRGSTDDWSATLCMSFLLASGASHPATPQPLPAGVLSPLRDVPPTLDGIAAEVASLEFKLDALLAIVQAVAGDTLDLGGDAGDPTDLAPDTPLDLANSAGAVLSASGIPASRSLDFGTPQNIVKLAKINVGNVDGWYPSIWMTHTPFVLRPLPQGVTKLTVTDITPGVTITSKLISKTK